MSKGVMIDDVTHGLIPEGKEYMYSISAESIDRVDFIFIRRKIYGEYNDYGFNNISRTVDEIVHEYVQYKFTINSYTYQHDEFYGKLIKFFSKMDGEYEILSSIMSKEIKNKLIECFHADLDTLSAKYFKFDRTLNLVITGKNKALS